MKGIGSNHKLKKEKILFLRVKLGNCVHYIQEIAYSACQWKKKKKEKERKNFLWPLFAENTTGNVNKSKDDKLP